jgi:hypothetical protein
MQFLRLRVCCVWLPPNARATAGAAAPRQAHGPARSWQLPWASLFGLALMRETTEAQAAWDARARVILRRLEAATHPHKDGLRSASP